MMMRLCGIVSPRCYAVDYVTKAVRRCVSINSPLRCTKQPAEKPVPSSSSSGPEMSLRNAYQPNSFERRCLVWTKKYKTLADVPAAVSPEVMEYSRNKMRIKIANYMALATIIGCIVMIYSGKKAAKRGEFITKQNLDWHNQYNAESANKDEAVPTK